MNTTKRTQFYATELALPPSWYGVGQVPTGMAQPWGQAALSVLPPGLRPKVWVGRGVCVVGVGLSKSFSGTLSEASAAYRKWANEAEVSWVPGSPLGAADVAVERDTALAPTNLAPQFREDPRLLLAALGAFPFDSKASGRLEVPQVALIGVPHLHSFLIWHEDAQALATEVLQRIGVLGQHPYPLGAQGVASDGKGWHRLAPEVDFAAWEGSIEGATSALRAGRAEKVVLARSESFACETGVDVRALTRDLLADPDQRCQDVRGWAFAIGDLVGLSPEVLAQVSAGHFAARVLAGTSLPGHGQELFNDPKEVREHEIARESVISKLNEAGVQGAQAGEVSILSLPNVDHLQSTITGQVGEGSDVSTITEVFHPTAAVCGKPREAAAELIAEFDPIVRENFTGPVGYVLPNGDGQWNLALRCAQTLDEDGLADAHSPEISRWRLLAGAGIMPSSTAQHEWDETGRKMGLMRQVLGINEDVR
ncbi:hypothetical protein BK816_07505 [Boudabousia tangfeifanii]|uniref:Chorismate-utilising enzyme C-terminal domain-containing protein n=1 Tax=Boudabousia tangfeifanii TaxID=1912795 RepID=A0A1D9MLI1_9ACTO|nr:chorismate-binding protein [Boudabousia tangfeifanii]AOZ73157.1 hypothetical protein BK816_07505 [Boudabousia tangfeifanii]